jgi:hypothetical protein
MLHAYVSALHASLTPTPPILSCRYGTYLYWLHQRATSFFLDNILLCRRNVFTRCIRDTVLSNSSLDTTFAGECTEAFGSNGAPPLIPLRGKDNLRFFRLYFSSHNSHYCGFLCPTVSLHQVTASVVLNDWKM